MNLLLALQPDAFGDGDIVFGLQTAQLFVEQCSAPLIFCNLVFDHVFAFREKYQPIQIIDLALLPPGRGRRLPFTAIDLGRKAGKHRAYEDCIKNHNRDTQRECTGFSEPFFCRHIK